MVKNICWVKYVAKIYLLTDFQIYWTKNEEMMANFHFFFQSAIPDQCALFTLLFLINDRMELVTKRSQFAKKISDHNVISDQGDKIQEKN